MLQLRMMFIENGVFEMDDEGALVEYFQPGEAVQVMGGRHLGKCGVVVEVCGDRVKVRSDSTGREVLFKPGQLVVVGRGAASTRETEECGEAGREVVGVQPLQNGRRATSTKMGEQGTPDFKAVEVQPLQLLEMLIAYRDWLDTDVLADCWIESYRRGDITYCRLVWHRSVDKKAQYIDPKMVEKYRIRIERGRSLRRVDALIQHLLGDLVPGKGEMVQEQRAAVLRMVEGGECVEKAAIASTYLENMSMQWRRSGDEGVIP